MQRDSNTKNQKTKSWDEQNKNLVIENTLLCSIVVYFYCIFEWGRQRPFDRSIGVSLLLDPKHNSTQLSTNWVENNTFYIQ